ncbi:uncharacterized protein LOC119381557 [Rhipicephalus sanguineus]|uniref:uncharacterized protein LOC119381557 n=1 Tax=Rhipicephalus sanguineus TaxID=34632 RepID=UPI0020C29518|nr:uncharacterized protein LOC119381557 [Rhipicephalus sanguineus]
MTVKRYIVNKMRLRTHEAASTVCWGTASAKRHFMNAVRCIVRRQYSVAQATMPICESCCCFDFEAPRVAAGLAALTAASWTSLRGPAQSSPPRQSITPFPTWRLRSRWEPPVQLLAGGRATLTCNQYPSSHKCRSPDLRSRSPDLRSRSPDLRSRSPDLRSRSPDLRSRSLDLRSRSPDHSLNPAEDSPGSWRKLCAGLRLSTCGRASVLMRGPWQTASSTTRCWSKTGVITRPRWPAKNGWKTSSAA